MNFIPALKGHLEIAVLNEIVMLGELCPEHRVKSRECHPREWGSHPGSGGGTPVRSMPTTLLGWAASIPRHYCFFSKALNNYCSPWLHSCWSRLFANCPFVHSDQIQHLLVPALCVLSHERATCTRLFSAAPQPSACTQQTWFFSLSCSDAFPTVLSSTGSHRP